MANKLKYILIILSVVVALTGLTIFGVLRDENNLEENTTLTIDGKGTSESYKVELTGFAPGDTKGYTIHLTAEDSLSDYSVKIKFDNHDKPGTLDEFLFVTITVDGEVVKVDNTNLTELLNADEIYLGDGISEITISFTMPESAGDESQNTSTVFDVVVTASNVEQE